MNLEMTSRSISLQITNMKALTIEMPYGKIPCYYFDKSETEPYTLLESYEAEDIRTKAPLVFGISNYHNE
jgi:hypothetical protein